MSSTFIKARFGVIKTVNVVNLQNVTGKVCQYGWQLSLQAHRALQGRFALVDLQSSLSAYWQPHRISSLHTFDD